MDFEIHMTYTEEQETFRNEVRAWLEANVPKLHRAEPGSSLTQQQRLENQEMSKQYRLKMGEKGWRAPTWPKEWGGGGLSTQQTVVLNEETSRARAPGVGDLGLSLGAPAILIHGTEEQKKRWLPDVITGKKVGWQVFTEPEAGSDLASLKTRGVRDGDEWVINGSKQFISGGGGPPDYLYTLVNTNPQAARHENISAFIIDAQTPGITIQRMDLIGMNEFEGGQHFVFFDNVRVPHENLVGSEGRGWQMANTTLELEHGGAGSVGGAPQGGGRAMVNRVIDYLKGDVKAAEEEGSPAFG